MPKKRPSSEHPATTQTGAATTASKPPIQVEAALSFLKDTKGTTTWSVRDVTDTLKINRRDAEQAVALLAAQGYVQRTSGTGAWMTTPEGESVSAAKPPRYARESVEQAVDALKERIQQANKDQKAAFTITDAVAFGDFLLSDRTRVQAADVGIGLTRRGEAANVPRSASTANAERQFLSQLRGSTAVLHIRPFADWMSKRSHRNLL
jgi:DNA-binding transcriptional regulator YhcF (GntR family)